MVWTPPHPYQTGSATLYKHGLFVGWKAQTGTIIRVGVDLAKNVLHIHSVDENEKMTWQGEYARNTWLKAIMKPFAKR